MTAPVSPPQPSIAPAEYQFPLRMHGGSIRDDTLQYVADLSSPHGAGARDAMAAFLTNAANSHASLKAQAEQAEQAVYLLESNAREQAKLLADTGRRVEDLEAALDKAIGYCDAAIHPTDQYNDEREALISILQFYRTALPPTTPAVSR